MNMEWLKVILLAALLSLAASQAVSPDVVVDDPAASDDDATAAVDSDAVNASVDDMSDAAAVVTSDDTATDDTASDDTASDDTASDDTASVDTASDDTATDDSSSSAASDLGQGTDDDTAEDTGNETPVAADDNDDAPATPQIIASENYDINSRVSGFDLTVDFDLYDDESVVMHCDLKMALDKTKYKTPVVYLFKNRNDCDSLGSGGGDVTLEARELAKLEKDGEDRLLRLDAHA